MKLHQPSPQFNSLLLLLLYTLQAHPLHFFFRCDVSCSETTLCLESNGIQQCAEWRLFSNCSSDILGSALCSLKESAATAASKQIAILDRTQLEPCSNNSDCRSGTSCQIFQTYKQGWCVSASLQRPTRQLSSCDIDQYLSPDGCAYCHDNCMACTGPSASDCSACPSATLLELSLSSCAATCLAPSFQLANLCDCKLHLTLACHSSCKSCEGPAANQCIECTDSFFKLDSGECAASCPPGYRPNLTTQTCQACDASCQECSPLNSSYCLSCASGYLLQGTCVNECPAAYYPSGSICSSCHPSCSKCAAPDTCSECKPNYLFNPTSSTCHSTCPFGFYTSESQCVTCNQACNTCVGPSAEECLSCPSNSFYLPSLSKCTHTCPDSFYLNHSIRQCLECPQNCLSCSDAQTCLSCSDSTILLDGACVQACPSQQFSLNGVCSPCSTFCLECNEQGCLRCSSVTLLQERDNKCVDSCEPGFFRSGTLCSPCDLRCETCEDSSSHCLQCSDSLLLVSSTHECASLCPPGFFRQDDSCLPCPLNCQECSSQSFCLLCESPFRLQDGTCVETCSDRFYPLSTTSCLRKLSLTLACDSTCLTCSGPAQSECLTCASPSLHLSTAQGGLCISQCPLSFYASPSACLPCHSSCRSCDGPSSAECTDCHPSTFLSSSPGTCSLHCPSLTYPDQSNHCQACSSQCQECFGPSSSECSSCRDSFVFVAAEHRCEPNKCPNYYYNHQSTGICLPCDESCVTCAGPESNNCLTCPYMVYYLPIIQECGTCPPYYQHNSWYHCRPCHFSCESCHGTHYNSCYSCKPPYRRFADSYTCTVSCPDNYYPSATYCSRCDRNCKTCYGNQQNHCLSCYAPKLLLRQDTYCMDPPCPEGYYSDSQECIKCHTSCATCDGPDPNNCLSCKNGDLFSHSTHMCYETCPPTTFSFEALCHDCHSSCATCTGSAPTNCLSCETPLIFLPETSECVESCPPSHFTFESTCIGKYGPLTTACDSSCGSCDAPGSHSCLSCVEPLLYNLALHTCTLQCHSGFYNTSLSTCEACHSSCSTCYGPTHEDCLSCPSPFVINPATHECSNQCSVSYYPEGDQCLSCHSSCASCDGPNDNNCLSCSPPLYFNQEISQCVDSCDLGYFLQDSLCKRCPTGCLTCSSPQLCFNCIDEYLLTEEGACLSQCPPAHFPQDGRCYSCDATCAKCDGSTSNHCIECAAGYLSLDSTRRCVAECPAHTHQKESSCYSCHASCLKCTGPSFSECSGCSDGYYPNDNLCICNPFPSFLECPSSVYYLRGTQLQAVLSSCEGLLSTQDILTSVLDPEVETVYASHVSNKEPLQIRELQELEDKAAFILAKSTLSSLSYSSPNLHFFKTKLFVNEKQTFMLDEGTDTGAQITLTIPKAALTSLNSADSVELLAVVFHGGLYNKQNFRNFESPVVSLALAQNQAVDPSLSSHFEEPLQLEFKIKGVLPNVKISGAYWDSGKWVKNGTTTRLSGSSAFISTYHLTAFSLIIDPQEGLLFSSHDSPLGKFYLIYWALFLAILVPAFLLDILACRREVFPHHKYIDEFRSLILQDCEGNMPPNEEQGNSSSDEDETALKRQNKLFARLLKYAILYSLPMLSPYSYRDRQIWASARALLLISEISLIFLFSLLVYGTRAYFFRSQALTYFVFGILLGLLLLPHSLLNCLLRRKMPALRANALPFRASPTPFAPQEGSRSKILVFLSITLFAIIVILTNVLPQVCQNVIDVHLLHIGLLTLISFFCGAFLGTVKIFLGASLLTSQQQERTLLHLGGPRSIAICLFVDYMTLKVYQDFQGHHQLKLHTIEYGGKTTKPEQKDTERIAPLFKEMYLRTQRLTLECNQEQRVESRSDKSDQSFFPASSKTSSAKIVVHSTFQRRSQRVKKN